MKERFAWGVGARLLNAGPLVAADMARAMSGAPFRIGGSGALEAGAGQFETLTSGSSGAPRRILRTMASWTASFAVNAGLFGIGRGMRVAVLGGLEQSLSLYGAVEALHMGAELQVLGGMTPRLQMAALVGVDAVWASPAQLRLLLTAGGDLQGLSWVIVGGSKLDDGLRAAILARGVGQVCEFYGAAEASFVTMARAATPSGSVGAPYPGVELAVRAGEVWLRSPYVFLRYAGADQGTARWQDGWLCVEEMGRISGGQLYLSGRAGRMVTVADQNVFPESIEAAMQAMAGVRDVAVLPRRDGLRGVQMVAFCLGDAARADAVAAAVRAQFGPLVAPRRIEWRTDWPRLPSGKTDLTALQAEVDAWP